MAFLEKTHSCLLLIVLISSLQIQARESKFFHMFTFISTKNKVFPESKISLAPTLAPAPAPAPVPTPNAEAVPTIAAEPAPGPAEAPTLFYAESGSGFGLYGRGSDQFPPTKESVTAATDENELLKEELSAENYETAYQNNNNGYTSNYNSNGYVTEKQGMSDTRFMQNYQSSNYNNNEYTNNNNFNNVYASNYKSNGYTSNRGYTGNNYNTNGYENEKQGISDTRFLENGKYYNDVRNENNYYANGFESERGTTINEGYYGNTQNVNEFNTMEEFKNKQEYQESPEEYVP